MRYRLNGDLLQYLGCLRTRFVASGEPILEDIDTDGI
jgi:hypothetical protein